VSEKKRLERAQAERTDGRASQLSHGGREAVKKGEERGKSSEEQKGERKERCEVLFPPCDTAGLVGFELDGRGRGRGIVSLAQFRYIFVYPVQGHQTIENVRAGDDHGEHRCTAA
jgi:hypothetical protein